MAGTASLPVSASLAELEHSGPTAAKQARLEALSTDLYQGILRCPGPCATDYTAPGDLECMKCFTLLRKNQ